MATSHGRHSAAHGGKHAGTPRSSQTARAASTSRREMPAARRSASTTRREVPVPRRGTTTARREAQGARTPLASESTRIDTIGVGQGAQVTTRWNASDVANRARADAQRRYAERHPEARVPQAGPKRSVFNVVLLVVAGVLTVAVVFALGTLVTSMIFPAPADEGAGQTQTLRPTESEQEVMRLQEEHNAGSEQVGADGSTVSYSGNEYALQQQESGAWALVNSAGDVLFEIEGTPVALVRAADTILIPENRDGSWDVVSYVIGGHLSGVTYVMGSDGQAVSGEGEAVSVELDGTTLRVTDAAGGVTDVALA